MRLLSIVFFTIIFSSCVFKSQAQSRQFENILQMKVKNSGVLTDQDNIVGYYFFYVLDKAKRGQRNYLLRILDQNLKDVNSTEIQEDKNVLLSEAKYNGTNIILKFVNFRDNEVLLMTFNRNAELLNRSLEKVDRMTLATYGSAQELREKNDLIPLPNRGFLNYNTQNGGRGYRFSMIPSDDDQQQWEVSSNQKTKGVQLASFMEASDDMLLNLVLKSKTATSKRQSFVIQAINLNNGQVIFENQITGSYLHQPLTAYYDESNGLMNILGIYYLKDTKALSDNGLGLFRVSVDRQGNYTDHTYLDWVRDFGRHMKVKANGKVGEKGKSYLYFHEIIQNADGSILAVGEQYRKVADAGGIASTLLLGGGVASTTKVAIEDMMLAQFSKDFDIQQIDYVEKTKSNFILPPGYDFVNIHYLSHIVKAYNGFDYRYAQKIDADEATAICYMDYEKPDKGKKKWIFGASIFSEGKFVHDRLDLDYGKGSSDNVITVFPGKPGYIVVAEYNEKEKTSSWHLERLNY